MREMSYKNFKLPSCIIRTSVYITIFGANAKAIKHFFIILISFLIMSILGICFTSTSRQKFLRKTFGFQPKILHGMLRKFSSLIQLGLVVIPPHSRVDSLSYFF